MYSDALGQTWAERQQQTDGIVVAFGEAALQTAAAQAGERVIDIGCGCGDTSIDLARRVGAQGMVLGVDVSEPMLDVARARAALEPTANLSFRCADASEADLPTGIDLLYSRFGVMFFADPSLAFGHLRTSLRPGGRSVFVCWRTPRDNAWTMTPLAAARKAMGVTPAPSDPYAPGPFAFADDERIRSVLSDAGFGSIQLQRFDAAVELGPTPQVAAENAVQIGPTARFVREVGVEHRDVIRRAVESALIPVATSDGRVCLNGSTWIVSAINP
jgi:ubiquinone/menaquinone biosynthesis C-methylase UbiE